jgi:hypothetical protein
MKSKVKLRKLEIADDVVAAVKQLFLDKFVELKSFENACKWVQNRGLPVEMNGEAVIGQLIEEDAEFRGQYDMAKRIVDRIRSAKAEDFLHKVGDGTEKTGKNAGISTANIIAATRVLEAFDKKRWSSKVDIEKTETRKITTIIKHYGDKETKVEVIDSPEVKALPDGNCNEE